LNAVFSLSEREFSSLRARCHPDGRQEARRIAALIPAEQRLVSTDIEASRDRVLRADLSGYRYLHFAAHGYLDNEHPEISAIVLSLVDRQGKQVDELLRVADIARLKAPAELVVLSACESGLAKEVGGLFSLSDREFSSLRARAL
jgi:CHAT domain-containing protein